VRSGISLADVESHLDRRTLKVQRRAGLAKPAEAAAAEAILNNQAAVAAAAASAAAATAAVPSSQ
jgi:hypothetical protein